MAIHHRREGCSFPAQNNDGECEEMLEMTLRIAQAVIELFKTKIPPYCPISVRMRPSVYQCLSLSVEEYIHRRFSLHDNEVQSDEAIILA